MPTLDRSSQLRTTALKRSARQRHIPEPKRACKENIVAVPEATKMSEQNPGTILGLEKINHRPTTAQDTTDRQLIQCESTQSEKLDQSNRDNAVLAKHNEDASERIALLWKKISELTASIASVKKENTIHWQVRAELTASHSKRFNEQHEYVAENARLRADKVRDMGNIEILGASLRQGEEQRTQLRERVTGLEKDRETQQEKEKNVKTQISGLEKNEKTLTQEINDIESQLLDLVKENTTLIGDKKGMENRISELDKDIMALLEEKNGMKAAFTKWMS
ncbi:hypothetical protein HBI56_108660 [Parastagonospora nodorum]|nr:hypothetical protein HBH53_173130 [Parastagonospora nodorum]KAH3980827.1 hypothetical protein HBH51_046960 [Parastagonospora nodorum]KAH4004515.1 hypothetical protein HBI10_048040 [Parastagonospora nodorum]KAH4018622.1 hypothetical protein HBI13_135070 [Parastagonospora nodorum]KAH4038736.1 hypothetical protein HBI09_055100 [Parastagonospora nodorum]